MSADSGAAGSGAPGTAGVIHDLGYRHYDGPRLGRGAIIRALYWHSLRSAYGIGRGAKAKIVPILTFAKDAVEHSCRTEQSNMPAMQRS